MGCLHTICETQLINHNGLKNKFPHKIVNRDEKCPSEDGLASSLLICSCWDNFCSCVVANVRFLADSAPACGF